MSKKPRTGPSATAASGGNNEQPETEPVSGHLVFGWWSLLFWLTLGLVLESLHGFKVGWYLDAGNEVRRLMLTLAHAHGTLLSIIHIGAGLTERQVPLSSLASRCLTAGSLLLPIGFLLGGVTSWSVDTGDPGLGVLLVIPGGLMLVPAVFSVARAVTLASRARRAP